MDHVSRPATSFLLNLIIAFMFASPSQLAAQDGPDYARKVTLGLYNSQGDYGAVEETDITYLPLSFEVARFPWIVSVTVPYISLDGPGDVFLEAGNIGRPGANQTILSERGAGDVILNATYQLDPILNDFAFLDLGVQVKVPTADETRDLGTGETDISYQADLYKTFGNTTVFTTLGYRYRGKTALYDLEDSAYFSFGGIRQMSETTNLGLLYDYREAASSSAYETHELMPFVSWEGNSGWGYMVYTIIGFTSSSADKAIGAQISYSW